MSKKADIISKLNSHFQKPYFGCKLDGTIVDIDEMTYEEVARRLVKLMFITPETEKAVEIDTKQRYFTEYYR